MDKAVDSIQQRLTSYASELNYESLPPEVVAAAKARIIDTLGIVLGGFFGPPCVIARNVAAQMLDPMGASIIGTRMKTTLDMAAFVNATTVCYPVLTDCYHWPGADQGHPSETITPLLGVAEHLQRDGRDFITAVVLAYEVCLRFSDIFHNPGFDNTMFVGIATAIGTGKLLGLDSEQMAHCISMAVVPNNILKQVRRGGNISMFKAVAPGQAARAGVFAALLARAGMKGPHLPFEGKAGWCDHIALERFTIKDMGGKTTHFKILDTLMKNRPSEGKTIAPILAAEKLAPLNPKDIKQIVIETHKKAVDQVGSGERPWNPQSREDADHSIPYVVAATLMDGTVTLRSFNDAHLWNPELRGLLPKTVVTEDPAHTKAYQKLPVEHRARVIVIKDNGERLVAETGADADDMSTPKTTAQIEEKFRGLTEEMLGAKRVNAILKRLWHLEDINNVAEIPAAFVI